MSVINFCSLEALESVTLLSGEGKEPFAPIYANLPFGAYVHFVLCLWMLCWVRKNQVLLCYYSINIVRPPPDPPNPVCFTACFGELLTCKGAGFGTRATTNFRISFDRSSSGIARRKVKVPFLSSMRCSAFTAMLK